MICPQHGGKLEASLFDSDHEVALEVVEGTKTQRGQMGWCWWLLKEEKRWLLKKGQSVDD
jgi:hypothetical protein